MNRRSVYCIVCIVLRLILFLSFRTSYFIFMNSWLRMSLGFVVFLGILSSVIIQVAGIGEVEVKEERV